ncbi:hypothetical protein Bbelb_021830 [Branchiostoma belcheri]|nr:hypothetical protein Bbelb_021830 [Branchiostoma belcheri]
MEQKFDAALPYERREKLRASRRRQWCQSFLKFPSAREHFRLLPTRAEDESRGLPRPFPTLCAKDPGNVQLVNKEVNDLLAGAPLPAYLGRKPTWSRQRRIGDCGSVQQKLPPSFSVLRHMCAVSQGPACPVSDVIYSSPTRPPSTPTATDQSLQDSYITTGHISALNMLVLADTFRTLSFQMTSRELRAALAAPRRTDQLPRQ